MNLKAALEAAAQAYEKRAERNPNGEIEVFGSRVSYGKAASEIRRVVCFVYPELETGNVQKVVRCKNCKYYKRYKKKGQVKPTVKFLCSIDKRERSPGFYCADGIEKEE